MIWGRPGEPGPAIGVWRMALALVTAAFLGGALGLVWQSVSPGEDSADDAAAAESDNAESQG